MIFCANRLPSLSLAEFHDYWLHKHGPLVRSLAPALRISKYVQSHRIDGDMGAEARRARSSSTLYDGVAELWWATLDDVKAVGTTAAGREAAQLLLQDEAKFVELSTSSIWFSHEHQVFP
jgi:hypothetical protein